MNDLFDERGFQMTSQYCIFLSSDIRIYQWFSVFWSVLVWNIVLQLCKVRTFLIDKILLSVEALNLFVKQLNSSRDFFAYAHKSFATVG